ncbi:MAG: RloB domain-containing protein [Planctomycetes bacterium]|nr:RloB domain-containing protein [Planctomycetota bacterium]
MVSSKQRRINDLKRPEASKEQHKNVLIVTEGKKTEPIYFKELKKKLRLKMVDVEIVGEGATPITVVNRAISLKKERELVAKNSSTKTEYDIIYCVVDVEAPTPHTDIHKAIDKAKSNALEIVLSNPCFEYWYILHFKKTSAHFKSSKNVNTQLKKYYPAYAKSDTTIFNIVYPKTNDAIKHSKEVLNEHHSNAADLIKCNPSTHVHKIVEYLLAQK